MFVQSPEGPSHGRVEVVLDGVVSPSGESLSDVFPSVADLSMRLEEGTFLRLRPRTLLDMGVELVVPPGCWGSYLSLICLEVRGWGVCSLMWSAMVVHWEVP